MVKEKIFKTKITELNRGTLKRVLTLSDVFAVGYGDLGSSIYYALGVTALYALGATPIALIIAGFVFACTALTYAEMSSMMMAAGGSSSFTRYAINDLVSFIAGWALLLDFIVTIAISAYSAIPYLAYFFPVLEGTTIKITAAVMIIGGLLALNICGSKGSTRVSWVLTSLTILTQAIIVLIGAFLLLNVKEMWSHLKIGGGTLWSPSRQDFFKGIAMAMVAYTGIESMAQLTSETKNPAKTVPRAIIYTTVLLILMYVGVSVVALAAVSPQVLSTQFLENPIAGIVSGFPVGKKWIGSWVSLLGAIILIVAANAGLIGASRVSFRMGGYHQLPKFLYKLHHKFRTPIVALSVFAILASLIVVWGRGRLDFLADLYNFGAMLAFFMAHLSLIFLRIRKPELERPFKISFGIPIGKEKRVPVSACVGLIATFGVWLNVIIFKPDGRYLGIIWVVLGLILYFVYRKMERIAPIPTLEIEKIKVPGYYQVNFEKILVPTQGNEETETVQMACDLAKLYKAEVTAINVIEIPFSMSIDTPVYHKLRKAEGAMKRAEAIARDVGVHINLQIIRARSAPRAILELAKEGKYDLIVVGAKMSDKMEFFRDSRAITEEIVTGAPCKVLVVYAKEGLLKRNEGEVE